jgi:hypothetical protein
MILTWYASPQARIINGTTRYFNIIIDANTASTTTYSTATAQQIYEFVQWTLRRPYTVDIDAGPIGRNGSVTRGLLSYSGSTLNTIYDGSDGGVYIDHFKLTDINNLAFADNTKAIRTYNYVSTGTLTFNTNLSNDADNATYRMFFKQINQGNIISTGYSISGSLAFGTRNAVLVKGSSIDLSGDSSYEIKGNLSGGLTSVSWDFLYENNLQAAWLPNNRYYVGDEYCVYTGTSWAWYRVTSVPVGYTYYTSGSTWGAGNDTSYSTLITNSLGLPAGPTVYLVSVGRSNGQYFVSDPYTIQKSTVNSIASTPIQEKNYGT